MKKTRLATVWMDGCSGCHMSLLDLDERLIAMAGLFDLVYSPLVDAKEFPEAVDVALIEGAVGNEEDLAKLYKIRERTKILVALGDCAVTSNVPGMRNSFPVIEVESRAYLDKALLNAQLPRMVIPRLLQKVLPLHGYVNVDLFIPGCPPSADTIHFALSELLAGRMPDVTQLTRFGA